MERCFDTSPFTTEYKQYESASIATDEYLRAIVFVAIAFFLCSEV